MTIDDAQLHRLRYEVTLCSDAGRFLNAATGSGLVEFDLGNQPGYIPPSDGVEGMLISVQDFIMPNATPTTSVLPNAGMFCGVDLLYAGQSNGMTKVEIGTGAGVGDGAVQNFRGRLLSTCSQSTQPPPSRLTYVKYNCDSPMDRAIYVPNHNLNKMTLNIVDEVGATIPLLNSATSSSRWVIHLVFQYLLKKL